MGNFIGIVGFIGTFLLSFWAVFKYILLGTYTLNNDDSKRLVERLRRDSNWTWVLKSERVEHPKFPHTFEVIGFVDGFFLFFSRGERLMTAGWKGKEEVSTVSFFRWSRARMDRLLASHRSHGVIPITVLSAGGPETLGELTADPDARVYLNEGSYEDIERDVVDVVLGRRKKTSCLLYGVPGNGKTQFIKYLARKYSLPIHVCYLRPDYDNIDVARMFSEVPKRCIVLLEDFDNYFHGRECIMKNEQVRFTYDSVINALDGVYNDYDSVVFAMTVNDISKVDPSLRSRPSRFKFVREFKNPDEDLRLRILGDTKMVEETSGSTLDEVFTRRDASV